MELTVTSWNDVMSFKQIPKLKKNAGFQGYLCIGRKQGKGDDEKWVRIIPGILYCNEPTGSVVDWLWI